MAGVESQPQRKQDRVGPARILIGLAIKYKTEKVQDNASRKKIKEMADSILAAASLSDDDRKATEGAFSSYESTWGVAPAAAAGGGADADAGLSSSDAATIDKERKRDRVGPARILIGLAGKYKTARVPDNASRKKIKEMADGILAATSLSDDDRKATEEAFASYESSWGVAPAAAAGGGADADAGTSSSAPPTNDKEWKFLAYQAIYNKSIGDWCSTDKNVLKSLFDRFVTHAQKLAVELHAAGTSVKMEESKKNHVHIHLYQHLDKNFHHRGKDALHVFAFEGRRRLRTK